MTPERIVQNGTELYCTRTEWTDVLAFYFLNYAAHATTIRSLPGETMHSTILASFFALLLPFSGIVRGIEAIARRRISKRNDLQCAAQSGALCIVVRTKDWYPEDGKTIRNVKIKPVPTTDARCSIELAFDPLLERVKLDSGTRRRQFDPVLELVKLDSGTRRRQIHGLHYLTKGYGIAILPPNADVVSNNRDGHNQSEETHISQNRNILRLIISLLQAANATITLYRTRGDQVNQLGYAAFGLTVIPYLIMSLINLLGSILTPDYQMLYLVRSDELLEAERSGSFFDGTVGMVLHREHDEPFTSVVKREGNVWRLVRPGGGAHDGSTTDSSESQPRIQIPAYRPFKGLRRAESWSSIHRLISIIFVMTVIGAVNIGVIGFLTGFQRQASTLTQRVVTMLWLSVDVGAGPFILQTRYSLAGKRIKYSRTLRQQNMVTLVRRRLPHEAANEAANGAANGAANEAANEAKHKISIWLIIRVFINLLLITPAIAGYVVVGQMLASYGTCKEI